MTTPILSEPDLLADLVATFAGIHARSLREFGAAGWDHGVWTGGEALMPDGFPIFYSLECADPEIYNGRVHQAFEEWLQLRGWYVEDYDGATFFIVPLPAEGSPE